MTIRRFLLTLALGCAPVALAVTAAPAAQSEAPASADEQLRALGYRHEEIVDAQELRRLLPPIASHCVGAAVAREDPCAAFR